MSLGLLGLSGLLQGGGFGVGYGFGVRLGYDSYGALKNGLFGRTVQSAQTARYSSNPFMSNMGSGILAALKLN